MGKLVEAATEKCVGLPSETSKMMGVNQNRVGLILGTGWGDPLVIERYVTVEGVLGFSDCSIGEVSAISGHAGKFIFGTWGDIPVVISSGRLHVNQVHDDPERLRDWMGILFAFMREGQRLIVTQAVGGLVPELPVGSLAIPATTVVAHLQPTYLKPGEFVTPEAELPRGGLYLAAARAAAATADLRCFTGAHYHMVCGPFFGGRGDRMDLKARGFHTVGMSLIPELAFTALENSGRSQEEHIRVGPVQFVTDNQEVPTHEGNTHEARAAAQKLGTFLDEIIRAKW